ncbi:MAG TPA: hypothetical protein VG326_18220 [Tepidisphaeraceae bacterium]|jgi:hypothetical protein|nr:hypothetical protein [Tepidisphaeraceae bacterium]
MPSSDPIQAFAASRRAARDHCGKASLEARKSHADPSQANPQAYLRQARRLRQLYAADPAQLQQRLGELSLKRDRSHPRALVMRTAESRTERRTVESDSARGIRCAPLSPAHSRFSRAVVDWFADHVASQLDERLLHFSKRQALLKTAERLGIGRFHANLIIAVAQHQAGETAMPSARPQPARKGASLVTVFVVVLIQTLIISAMWFVLRGG